MVGCSRWPLRVLLVVAVYIASAYMIYDAVGRLAIATLRPGVELLVYTIFYNVIIVVVSLASTIVILYTTGSLIAASSTPLTLLLVALSSPYRWVLASSIALVLVLLGLLVLARTARGGMFEPVFDLLARPRVSPTALSASAVALYTSWALVGSRIPCELSTLYVVPAVAGALIASTASYSLIESLLLGLIAGLGPLGLAFTASYASLKPLRLEPCEGVIVGELLGFTEVASRPRALLPVTGEPRGSMVVCSQKSKAVLELEEPWIAWVYGVESRRVAEVIALNQGGGVVLSLEDPGPSITEIEGALREALGQSLGGIARVGLGGIEPYEARIALLPSIAEILRPARTLVLEAVAVDRDQMLRLAFETSRKHPRLVIALPEIPWAGEMLAPRGPAKTAALIVTRLTDPQQAENIARTLTPRQATHVKEALLKGSMAIAHPGCKGKTIIFRPQTVRGH
ncbi:MAG: hypothetical protein ACO2O2_15930 [Acidilobaceae archaeon]